MMLLYHLETRNIRLNTHRYVPPDSRNEEGFQERLCDYSKSTMASVLPASGLG